MNELSPEQLLTHEERVMERIGYAARNFILVHKVKVVVNPKIQLLQFISEDGTKRSSVHYSQLENAAIVAQRLFKVTEVEATL